MTVNIDIAPGDAKEISGFVKALILKAVSENQESIAEHVKKGISEVTKAFTNDVCHNLNYYIEHEGLKASLSGFVANALKKAVDGMP